MNINTFSKLTRLSAHTLRYYEKIGLLTEMQRNQSGHRVYTSKDLEWVKFITRLKETGMPLEDIVVYSKLRSLGDSTIAARQELLEAHYNRLKFRIENELEHLKALEIKIEYYKTQKVSRLRVNSNL